MGWFIKYYYFRNYFKFRTTGTFTAGGGIGSSGQVLKSTGTGIEWANEIDITTSTNYGTATTNNLTLGNSSASSQELTINALGGVTYTGHLIPSSNATYDIGSAEYKVRHLYLSDSSLWIGDRHKIDITSGKIKFKKRKAIPTIISDLGDHSIQAKAFTGRNSTDDITINEWVSYARTIPGLSDTEVDTLFRKDETTDWEEDKQLDDLAIASDSVLGGIKVGINLSIDINGVLSSINTTYTVGDGGLTQNNFTDTLKTKLDNIDTNANNYSLPSASTSVLGG